VLGITLLTQHRSSLGESNSRPLITKQRRYRYAKRAKNCQPYPELLNRLAGMRARESVPTWGTVGLGSSIQIRTGDGWFRRPACVLRWSHERKEGDSNSKHVLHALSPLSGRDDDRLHRSLSERGRRRSCSPDTFFTRPVRFRDVARPRRVHLPFPDPCHNSRNRLSGAAIGRREA
jgi:hypothetical protein